MASPAAAKRLRVCVLTEYYYPDNTGGTPTVLSNLTRYLKDHYSDLEITVITSRNLYRGEAGVLPAREMWDGIDIIRLNSPKSNRPSTLLRLAAGFAFTSAVLAVLARQPRYDVLLVVTNPPTLPMAIKAVGRMRRIPYVYLVHDLYPDLAMALKVLSPSSPAARLLQRLQRGWLHAAHRTIVLGRCMRDYLVEQYGLPAERIEVITNWSDVAEVVPPGAATRFRTEHGLTGTLILYAGNFGQYQNFDNILEAAKRLRDTHPDLTFVFVGDGAKRAHLAERIGGENIANARMFPFVSGEQFPDLLASADISLVTLEPGAEGLGVPSKFYNILASARPTVAIVAQSSEVACAVAESGCGVQVDQGDPEQLAAVIAGLAGDPERRLALGRNARAAFEQKYTLQQVAKRFHAALREAAGAAAFSPSGAQVDTA